MKIQETLRNMVDQKKAELAKKGGGGPNASQEITATAEIVVRGKDGKVKQKIEANNTEITL